MVQRTVNLSGTTVWTNAGLSSGQIRLGSGAALVNQGVFQDNTASSTSINNNLGGGGTFTNQGTYTKSGAVTTTVTGGVSFVNSAAGTVSINAGTLALNGGSSAGVINGVGTLQYDNGTNTLAQAPVGVTTQVNGGTVTLYKQSSSGWTAVALLYEVSFSNANTSVNDGYTLTQMHLSVLRRPWMMRTSVPSRPVLTNSTRCVGIAASSTPNQRAIVAPN